MGGRPGLNHFVPLDRGMGQSEGKVAKRVAMRVLVNAR